MSCNSILGADCVEDKSGGCTCTNTFPNINGMLPKNQRRMLYDMTPPLLRTGPNLNPRGLRNTPTKTSAECAGMIAPAGYVYLFDGKTCNMVVDYNYDPAAVNLANSAVPAIGAVATVETALQNFFGTNKSLLEIGGLAVLGYFAYKTFGKGGGRAKSEKDVITRRF